LEEGISSAEEVEVSFDVGEVFVAGGREATTEN